MGAAIQPSEHIAKIRDDTVTDHWAERGTLALLQGSRNRARRGNSLFRCTELIGEVPAAEISGHRGAPPSLLRRQSRRIFRVLMRAKVCSTPAPGQPPSAMVMVVPTAALAPDSSPALQSSQLPGGGASRQGDVAGVGVVKFVSQKPRPAVSGPPETGRTAALTGGVRTLARGTVTSFPKERRLSRPGETMPCATSAPPRNGRPENRSSPWHAGWGTSTRDLRCGSTPTSCPVRARGVPPHPL